MGRRYAIGAVFAAALVLGLGSAGADSGAGPVAYGVTLIDPQDWALDRLDARTLRPLKVGRLSDSPGRAWSFSPDGTKLALGFQLFDLRTLRSLGQIEPVGGPDVLAVAWVRPDRLIAVVLECCSGPDNQSDILAVLTIDPLTRHVLSRVDVGATLQQAIPIQFAKTADGIAFLLMSYQNMGPTRLLVATADGSLRSVSLAGVPSGVEIQLNRVPTTSFCCEQVPALAVDQGANRAFVLAAGTPVAEVDLASLTVNYHSLAAATFALRSATKGFIGGTERVARFLPSHLLAITGSDVTAHADRFGRLHSTSKPAGLQLVDTNTWSTRGVEPRASTVSLAGGLLLAYGVSWPTEVKERGAGLSGYGPDGALRFHVLGSAPVQHVSFGSRYAYLDGTSYRRVLELPSGRIVKAGQIGPGILLGGSDSFAEPSG